MRSKSVARRKAPSPSRSNRGILIGAALLLIGAAGALTLERMPSGPAAAPSSASRSASPAPTRSAAPIDSALPSAPSESPSPSPSPASAILEAEMPTQIGGVVATITSARGPTALGPTPAARALGAAATKLGTSVTSLELAYGYDPSGSQTASVLGFRIDGVTAAVLEPIILDAWLSAGAPGVTVSDESLSGVQVKHVSYGDQGADEWVVAHGDAVFVVETRDKAIATSTIAALRPVPPIAPSSPASPGGSAPSSSSASPSPGGSAVSSPSGLPSPSVSAPSPSPQASASP